MLTYTGGLPLNISVKINTDSKYKNKYAQRLPLLLFGILSVKCVLFTNTHSPFVLLLYQYVLQCLFLYGPLWH